jgi:hypothetical protein
MVSHLGMLCIYVVYIVFEVAPVLMGVCGLHTYLD